MARARNKEELMAFSKENYIKLNKLIEDMTEKELNTAFDFSNDDKKKETHWKRDKNLKDVLIHIYEWQRLLLEWVKYNIKGKQKSFLPDGYNWKNYGLMNEMFWKKHQNTSLDMAIKKLEKSHKEVLELAQKFTNEELFEKNKFSWVGGSSLGSYFVSVASSHYDWAIKKLKAHKKNCK